ncbi:Niemann-Pick C1 protein-like protein [Dinothrombium tinctorium]|uniref:Niemann-Pick C1 protein-like protein n=1 Tax=Dinothrombium tinctorium TaxID=1965070 RepID=A0A3S3PN80_9ACAR|nr:Niemann-Pick C1 protein-like protein [Dinothrombium tinctorium]
MALFNKPFAVFPLCLFVLSLFANFDRALSDDRSPLETNPDDATTASVLLPQTSAIDEQTTASIVVGDHSSTKEELTHSPSFAKSPQSDSVSRLNIGHSEASGSYGKCLIGGKCGFGGFLGSPIPCVETRNATRLSSAQDLRRLAELCPDLLANDDNPELCCDSQALEDLETNLRMPKELGLGKCSSCFANFRKNFCEMVCSPHQSSFVEVVAKEPVNEAVNPEAKGKYKLIEMNYYMRQSYANGLFESCKSVKHSTGKLVLSLVCGSSSDACTPNSWLEFIGRSDRKQGFAPFQINYRIVNESVVYNDKGAMFTPMAAKTFSCAESPGDGQFPCSCFDCEATCEREKSIPRTMQNLPNSPEKLTIFGQLATEFIGKSLFVLFTTMILVYFILMVIRKKKTFSRAKTQNPLSMESHEPNCILSEGKDLGSLEEVEPLKSKGYQNNLSEPQSPPQSPVRETSSINGINGFAQPTLDKSKLKLGLRLEIRFESLFTKWGIFVATHPIYVMLVGLIVSIILSCGLFCFKVTTDPIDLWVASGSQARKDMEFFNKNFWKFYRVEQLIISPVNQSSFLGEYIEPGVDPEDLDAETSKQYFGPAFEHEFMKEVFRLQQAIENLRAYDGDREIKLNDICFKPTDTACATQSVFTYYLNDFNELDQKLHYLLKILICTNNPTSTAPNRKCFPDDGIPLMYPEVAFGGTYLASFPTTWFDNYIEYLNSHRCCYVNVEGSQCLPEAGNLTGCERCIRQKNGKRTVGEDFNKYLPFFLRQNPDVNCVLGGKAQFGGSVKYKNRNGEIIIGPSYIMTYRSVLKTSSDFYEALRWSRIISERLTQKIQESSKTNAFGVGISVEFCSHLVRSYIISNESNKVLRAKDALSKMGSSFQKQRRLLNKSEALRSESPLDSARGRFKPLHFHENNSEQSPL